MRSGPQTTSRTIVGRALDVSKKKNLTTVELKVLTDVVHYEVNKKQLLRSSRNAIVQTITAKHEVICL